MNVKELRKMIENNNLDVKITARTNGQIRATAFDFDDMYDLNQTLKTFGYKFQVFMPGTQFMRYDLVSVGA